MRNSANKIQRSLLVVAGAMLAALLFAVPAMADGPTEPTPAPLPVAGSQPVTTTVQVQLTTLPDTEFFAKNDCAIFDTPIEGYQVEVYNLKAKSGVEALEWSEDGVWVKVGDVVGNTYGWTLSSNLERKPQVTASTSATCDGENAACGTPAVQPASGVCWIYKSSNLRGGPGTTYAIQKTVVAGTKLTIVGLSADEYWYKLDGGAWIAAFLCSSTELAKPAVQPATCGTCAAPVPAQPQQPAAPPATPPSDSCVPEWGDEDEWTTLDGVEIPFGDGTGWTVIQAWNGADVATTTHILVAPGTVLRISAGWKGSQWHVWTSCPTAEASLKARVEQMATEVAARDGFGRPTPHYISAGGSAPNGWVVQPFPH